MTIGPVRKQSSTNRAWWLHPTALVFVFLLPLYLLIWVSGEFTAGGVSTSKAFFFLKGPIAWLGLAGLLLLGIGTLSPIRPRDAFGSGDILNSNVLVFLGTLTLLGYAYWFKDFVLHPNTILTAIRDSASFTYAIRKNLDRSADIASLAQLGLPYLIGYGYLIWAIGLRPSRVQRLMFWMILLAITFRAFAWAERIAVIEAALALCFVWAPFRAQSMRGWVGRLVAYVPVLGALFVVALFAVSEYFRSWSAFYYKGHSTFVEFIGQRLVNYYYNALNTGAGRLAMLEWPTNEFESVFRWVHKMPIFGSIFSYLTGARRGDYAEFLYRFGDPEFNNPSGLFSVYYDIGVAWGFVLFLLLGVLAKFFYSYWQRGKSFTGAVYFIFLMTFLEFFRYLYIGDSRCFMVVFGLVLLILTTKEIASEQGIGKGLRAV